MLAMRLVRLIEAHSEVLSKGLTEQIRKSDRTSDFRKLPAQELRLAATEVYRNLGEWLLQKTENDIAARFGVILTLWAAGISSRIFSTRGRMRALAPIAISDASVETTVPERNPM